MFTNRRPTRINEVGISSQDISSLCMVNAAAYHFVLKIWSLTHKKGLSPSKKTFSGLSRS